MKKLILLTLTVLLCTSFVACNDNEPTDTTVVDSDKVWTVESAVDEFGDEVEDGNPVLRSTISGTFSNSATNSSELGGDIYITPTNLGTEFIVVFRLQEYNSSPVTFTTNEANNIILKTKVEDTISEYKLTALEPNGDLYLYGNSGSDSSNFFFNLQEGKDIRCIIEISTSKYNFTVASANFKEVCNEATAISSQQAAEGKVRLLDCFLQPFFA